MLLIRFPGQYRQTTNPRRCGCRHLVGGEALGRLAGSLRSAGYAPEEVDLVLVTHLHSDHVGGLTTQDGKRVFANAEVYVARPKATFGCRRKSLPRRQRMRNRSSRVRKPSQRRISKPVSGTRLVAPSQSSTACDSSRCLVIPRDIPAMNFRQGTKNPVWGDIIHAQRVQLQHPEVTAIFDIDPTAAAATRINCCLSSRARMF